MTRAGPSLAAVVLACAAPAAAAPLEDKDIAAIAKRSLVYIAVQGVSATDGKYEAMPTTATGFLISAEGFLVTARHVLQDAGGRDFQTFRKLTGVVGGGKSTSQEIPLTLIQSDANHDVALLKLAPTGRELVPIAACKEEPPSGSRLIAYGFAFDREFTVTPGNFSNPAAQGGRWQVTIPFTHGMSGGPVYDGDGHVRAIVKGGVKGEASLSSVTPVRFIDSWLREHDTPVRCGADKESIARASVDCVDGFLKPLRMDLEQTKRVAGEIRAFLDRPDLEGAPDYIQSALRQPQNRIWRKRAETLLQTNADAAQLIRLHGSCVKDESLEQSLAEFREHADKFRELWEIILSDQPAPRGAHIPHVQSRFPEGLEDQLTRAIQAAQP